jgi:hypothetical protein
VKANEPLRPGAAGSDANLKILLDYPGMLRPIDGWETSDFPATL